jgi:hypothetical protein
MVKQIYNYYFESINAYSTNIVSSIADLVYNVDFSNLPQNKPFKGSITMISRNSPAFTVDDIIKIDMDLTTNNFTTIISPNGQRPSSQTVAISGITQKSTLNVIDIKNTDNPHFYISSSPKTPFVRVTVSNSVGVLTGFNTSYTLILTLEEAE